MGRYNFMHQMRQNLMLNGVDGSVCLHEFAVSDEDNANATLAHHVGSGIHRDSGFLKALPRTQVRTTTLDGWAAQEAPFILRRGVAPAFLLVTLDIEGAAALALKGAPQLMRRVTHVFIGIHSDEEWTAAQRAFAPPQYEVLLSRRHGDARSPNGVFIARRARPR